MSIPNGMKIKIRCGATAGIVAAQQMLRKMTIIVDILYGDVALLICLQHGDRRVIATFDALVVANRLAQKLGQCACQGAGMRDGYYRTAGILRGNFPYT